MKTAQQVKIYHAAFEVQGKEVATFTPVTCEMEVRDALDASFRSTQNIEGSWSRYEKIDGEWNGDFDKRISVVGGKDREFGLRSTSVGDAAEVVVYNSLSETIEREYFVLTMNEAWERVLPFEFDMYLEAQSMGKCMVRNGEAVRKIGMGEAA